MIRSDWLDISIKQDAASGVWAELAVFFFLSTTITTTFLLLQNWDKEVSAPLCVFVCVLFIYIRFLALNRRH